MSALAQLSPEFLQQAMANMTPEQLAALGLRRPATDAEVSAYQQAHQAPGAPADFGGMVLPNPNGIKVSDDTDSGIEPTRLPNGVTFQKQNFTGTVPGDVSNPPRAALATTVGDWFSENAPKAAPQSAAPPAAGGDWFDQNSPAAAKTEQPPAKVPGFFDDPKGYLESRAKQLQGESQRQTNLAMGPESEGKPFYERLGHRLLSLAPETAALVDKLVAGGMDWKGAIAIASGALDPAIPAAYFGAQGAAQLTGLEPGIKAGDVSPENVQNALLAGSAVAGGAGAGAAPGAGSTAELIKGGLDKARAATPKQAAQAVGAASGAISGHGALSAPGAYYGAKTAGAIAEGLLGKDRANAPILPQKPAATAAAAAEEVPVEAAPGQGAAEEFEGVTSPQTAHASETIEAEPETKAAVSETPAEILNRKASPADLEKALNEALGGKPLEKNAPLRSQATPAAGAATAKPLPEGFTPVDSSLLKGYKYDPAAKEFTAILKNGESYTHGEVTPEQVEAFENSDSQGSAWTKQIKQGAGTVLTQKNGRPVVSGTMKSAETGATVPKSEAGMTPLPPELEQKLSNLSDFIKQPAKKALATPAAKAARVKATAPAAADDLTAVLQQSLEQAPGKGGVFTSAEPQSLLDRWGVSKKSLAATDENLRGMAPKDSEAYIDQLAEAYKKGQAVEPVLETRDAQNNIVDVDGRHRALAAAKAGLDRIPIVVRRLGVTADSAADLAARPEGAGAGGTPTSQPIAQTVEQTPLANVAKKRVSNAARQRTIPVATGAPNAENLSGNQGTGQAVPEPNRASSSSPAGADTAVKVPGEDRSYRARYQVRELEDVQPSHSGITFRANEKYALTNDRDYSNQLNQGKVITNAAPGKFDPAYHITDNPDATNGPVVIDSEGHALGGNGRAMILQRVYDANPEGAAAYKALLEKKAAQFGLDPKAIGDMKRPVLVREIADHELDPAEKQTAITDFNKKGTAELTPAERAIADSRRISQSTLDNMATRIEQEGPSATLADVLKGQGGTQILDRLIQDGVLTPQERAAYANKTALTEAGSERIRKLMVGRFFRDPLQIDATPAALRNKLESIAAPAATLDGLEGWDLTPHIQSAIDLLEEARTHGMKNLDDLLAQQGFWGDSRYSPEALELAKHLQNTPGRTFVSEIRHYAADAADAHRPMFAEQAVKPDQAFRDAFQNPKGTKTQNAAAARSREEAGAEGSLF